MALHGEQYRRFVQVINNPAAGAELDISPFTQGAWLIRSVEFQLAVSANGTSRTVALVATDGTSEWWRSPVVSELVPSQTQLFVAHPGIVGGGSAGPEVAKQASAVFAAAATGTVSLAAGDEVTGFTISYQAIAAALAADVTLTNVFGGTMTFRLTQPVAGLEYSQNFPDPIPALNGGVAPTLSTPGVAGSPAGSLVLYGRSGSLDQVISQAFPDEGIYLEQGWHLRTLTGGLDVADQYSKIVIVVEEHPSGPDYRPLLSQPFTVQPLDN